MKKIFGLASILFILLLSFAIIQAGKPLIQEGIIFPGEGVDDIRIGEVIPEGVLWQRKDEVELKFGDGKRVKEVIVRSPYFYIIRSRVRVGGSIDVILRFYGEGELEVDKRVPEKIMIRYPSQGIDFEISKYSKQITGIRIYQPTLPKSLK